MQKFDAEDPDTWDDTDPLALAAAAMGLGDAASPEDEPGDESGAASDKAAPETEAAAPAESEPAPTKDGQHEIPGWYVGQLRQEAREAKAEADRLRRELDAVRNAAATETDTTAQAPTDGWAAERAALEVELAAISDDEDDAALANALRRQIAQGDRLHALEQRVQQGLAQTEQRFVETEEQARDRAWSESPLLQAWAADTERPLWHRTAISLHQQLLADPSSSYTRMSWTERFAALPGLVEAQLGVTSPHRPQTQASGKPLASAAPSQKAPAVPASVAHIPGGEARDPAPRSLADMEGLPEAQQREFLVNLAEQGRLWDQLKHLPWGALNAHPDPRGRR